MAFAPQGLDRIGEWKKKTATISLVAIGGITLERAPGVFAAGADIVSAVTDISLNADFRGACARLGCGDASGRHLVFCFCPVFAAFLARERT